MERVTINISDYGQDFKKKFNNKDLITIDELLSAIEDLICEVEDLEDQIRKLENADDWEEDYIPEDY